MISPLVEQPSIATAFACKSVRLRAMALPILCHPVGYMDVCPMHGREMSTLVMMVPRQEGIGRNLSAKAGAMHQLFPTQSPGDRGGEVRNETIRRVVLKACQCQHFVVMT